LASAGLFSHFFESRSYRGFIWASVSGKNALRFRQALLIFGPVRIYSGDRCGPYAQYNSHTARRTRGRYLRLCGVQSGGTSSCLDNELFSGKRPRLLGFLFHGRAAPRARVVDQLGRMRVDCACATSLLGGPRSGAPSALIVLGHGTRLRRFAGAALPARQGPAIRANRNVEHTRRKSD